LKAEIIQSISYNWMGIGVNIITPAMNLQPACKAPYGGTWCPYTFTFMIRNTRLLSKWMSKLQEKMEEFETSNIYNGTGLSTETSKRSGRIIYRYIDIDGLGNLLSI